ncbi:alpha/beta fold hydrolase [Actinocatenispora sera]|uniref:alpha/beta fold hydrolase n=1 Tax=Actinocatenispora sera TaxID=390989 RepID=UPI00340516D4
MREAAMVAAELVPDRRVAAWPVRKLWVRGLASRMRVIGESGDTPIAYVHGLGGSALDWTMLGGLLAPRRGYALDLPGFGGSAPLRRCTLPALAGHVAAWLAGLDGPVHLVGNSLGGAVTVRVAAAYPELVRSLTLISPAMPFHRPWQSQLGPLVPAAWLPGAAQALAVSMRRLGPAGLTRQSLDNCMAQPDTVTAELLDAFVAEAGEWLTTPWHADVYLRTFRALLVDFLRGGTDTLWSAAARITAPTLVVWGRGDRLVPVRLAERLAATIPDARLRTLDGVGHVAQLESPRTVARALLALVTTPPG